MWRISRRGPRAKNAEYVSTHQPGADALRAFLKACDTGKPGAYELTDGPRGEVLARGAVQAQEMVLTWRADRVLYALGVALAKGEIEGVVAFLRAQEVSL